MKIPKCPQCGLLLESDFAKTCKCKNKLSEAIFLNNHVVPKGTEYYIRNK